MVLAVILIVFLSISVASTSELSDVGDDSTSDGGALSVADVGDDSASNDMKSELENDFESNWRERRSGIKGRNTKPDTISITSPKIELKHYLIERNT